MLRSVLKRALRRRAGISTQLLRLTLLQVLAFALGTFSVGLVLDSVRQLLTELTGTEMARVVDNAAVARGLSAAFAEIDQVSRSCRDDVAPDSARPARLSARILAIAGAVQDPALDGPTRQLAAQAHQLLTDCAAVGESYQRLRAVDRRAFDDLSRLETVISRMMIDETLAGRSVQHLDQIMGLTTGLRESLLTIGQRVGVQGGALGRYDAGRRPATQLIDELALQLQTLSASPAAIAAAGRDFGRTVAAYRTQALQLDAAESRFVQSVATGHATQASLLAGMNRLDADAAGRAGVVRAQAHQIIDRANLQILVAALAAAGLSLACTIWVIRRAIHRPLIEVLSGIEAIRTGAGASPSACDAPGEWGTIQSALRDLAEGLARSDADLRRHRERLELALRGANDGLWDWNLDSDDVHFSPRWKSMLGHDDASLPNRLDAWWALVHPDDLGRLRAALDDCRRARTPGCDIEFRMRHADGHWVDILARGTLARDAGGALLSPRRLVGTHVDISERKYAEGALRRAASVFTHAREGIMITSPEGRIVDVNAAFCQITGYARDEALGQTPRLLKSGLHGADFYAALWGDLSERNHWHGEIWNRRKDGQTYVALQTISAVRDERGVVGQYVALFYDVTAAKQYEQRLEQMAHFDALTGLPNRVLLARRLHDAMAQCDRHGRSLAVVYLDLDGFKDVNDRFGHEAGDRLLLAATSRMSQVLRAGDTLARLGGDEFVAVLLDMPDALATVPVLQRLLAACAEPVPIGDALVEVSASLGVAAFPQVDRVDADQLLRQADFAMYQAKLAGKSRYHFFDADQQRSERGQQEGLRRIRQALVDGEFVLHYQPKLHLASGQITGAEALIRWQHPQRGLLPPLEFLPLIESHPLSVELGDWVIDTALRQIERWRAMGLDLAVSVNVGAMQLLQPGFPQRLAALLAAHPSVRPQWLELEMLETSALGDIERAAEVIDACRSLGVGFALDDFGTGYSSLTYLKQLPVTHLKIDRSFVRDMLEDPFDLAIIKGVLGFARAFGLQVTAEGVETAALGARLMQLGCDQAQGYGIARPMPADQLPDWVACWRPDPAWHLDADAPTRRQATQPA
ncbi:MAG TPA: EAL domain-containing protein [Burkholderiaceae bacterium]|nr:EAL domain-containing protein [Burkholderiaceae bacterium]